MLFKYNACYVLATPTFDLVINDLNLECTDTGADPDFHKIIAGSIQSIHFKKNKKFIIVAVCFIG